MERLFSWFILKQVPGIGNFRFKKLLERFGTPEQILGAPKAALCAVEGISAQAAERIIAHRRTPSGLRRSIQRVYEKGFRVIVLTDADYPPLLREIADPPPLLYVKGVLQPQHRYIAIEGSRMATQYGLETTRELARQLAEANLTVVSGMAKGIDTAAHQGALMASGPTVAVLGSGVDIVYPRENHQLYHRIAESGAVISELDLGAGPEPHHFPARNRIISGMSLGVVIVEATKQSGSLITARFAAEQNREVFAIPGSIRSFKSAGSHHLLKQGAKLVEHVQDILEELPPCRTGSQVASQPADVRPRPLPPLAPEALAVYQALEPYPMHIDVLVRKIGMPTGKIAGILLALELKGLVEQSTGKYFSKREVSA